MPNRSARKGKAFERELVQQAVSLGVPAYRCWGSDGRSRGHSKDVDLVLQNSIKLQTKRRSKLPSWLGFSENVDGVVIRQDHGKAIAIVQWDWLLELLKTSANDHSVTNTPQPIGGKQ